MNHFFRTEAGELLVDLEQLAVLSLTGVLVAGSAAALVNTQVLRNAERSDASAIDFADPSSSTDSSIEATDPSTTTIQVSVPSTEAAKLTAYQVGSSGLVTVDTAGDVLRIANETGAIPYDIPGVELTHVGELCSFDAFLSAYKLEHPALKQLAEIVRGADTSRLDLTPQSPGLYAISLGLSEVFKDDHEMLKHGLVMYDALYAWCCHCQCETHNWPPKM